MLTNWRARRPLWLARAGRARAGPALGRTGHFILVIAIFLVVRPGGAAARRPAGAFPPPQPVIFESYI
ncbi:unnamed protein product [Parnassius apollo]|uniref:(apollo) hypothetical protein n=1 Tax=Parnassius apollo TaxID=110799 RepID=A0A8S3Y0C4_PARAO|nr:unnamed protein product [Parnassius apollo]